MSKIAHIAKSINNGLANYPRLSMFIAYLLPKKRIVFGKEYQNIYNNIDFNNVRNESKLLQIANYSVNHVPYYSSIQNERIFSSIEEFETNFKLIDKGILIKNFDYLLSDNFRKETYETVTTGGTSGPPAKFYIDKKRYQKEYAYYHKIWATKGYNGQFRGVIRNHKLPNHIDFKINPITREIIFDGFRTEKSYYHKIYKILRRYSIEYLQCYPSSAYHFANEITKRNLSLNFLKGLFLSSENYLEYQRNFLKHGLELPVISIYGHSEKLILAVDFDGCGNYQVINDYGYFELIDIEGNVIKEIGISGEIVGTTFDNLGQPLVRYKTGDFSSYLVYDSNGKQILNAIEGRWYEMKIYNEDHTFVTPTALNLHDELYTHIEGLQYYQAKKGYLDVKIIPGPTFTNKIESQLLEHFKNRLSLKTKVRICKVQELYKKQNGKFTILETEVSS